MSLTRGDNTQKIPLVRLSTARLFVLQANSLPIDIDNYLIESGFPEVITEKNSALYLPEVCLLGFVDKLSKSLPQQQFARYLQGVATLLIKQLLDKNYINCQNIEQAVNLFTKQISSYSNHQYLQLEKYKQNYRLQVEGNSLFEQGAYWGESLTLLLMIQFVRQATDSQWLPKAIYFKNDNLVLLTEHLEFTSIQVYFAQPQLSIEIESELLNFPLAHHQLLHSKREFQSLPVLSFRDNVAHALAPYIGCDNCSVDQFCLIVGMHKRQLQRLLKAEGCSYKQIKEQLSINFAIQLIQGNRYSMADIAEHLGYLSTSQFARAVKRVTGKTPSQHR